MGENLEPRRLYTDEEISRIIKRAAELQNQAGRADSSGRGISIVEIEQIARELGIDPSLIRQAATELGGSDDSGKASLFGQTLIEARRLVKGEITERQWEMMVQEIRRALGHIGETGKLGQALEWKTSDKELVSYQVTASPREGKTDIQIVSRRDGAAFLTYFLTTLVGLFGALSVAAPTFTNPIEWLAAGGVMAGTLGAARLLFGWLGGKGRQTLNRLAAKLETIASEAGPSVADEPVAASPVSSYEESREEDAGERVPRPAAKERA